MSFISIINCGIMKNKYKWAEAVDACLLLLFYLAVMHIKYVI